MATVPTCSGEYAGRTGAAAEVNDPYGGSLTDYRDTYTQLKSLLGRRGPAPGARAHSVRVSGSTRVFAILGDPVAHSLSPAMQNAAFRVLGLDAVYVPLRCSAADLPGLMASLARAGGGGNVTIPHKAVAARVRRPAVGMGPRHRRVQHLLERRRR